MGSPLSGLTLSVLRTLSVVSMAATLGVRLRSLLNTIDDRHQNIADISANANIAKTNVANDKTSIKNNERKNTTTFPSLILLA